MANKRELKNGIRRVCGDIACSALLAVNLFPKDVNSEKINDILNELAALQEDTVRLISFVFDKGEDSFSSRKEYRDARSKYYSIAYKKLEKDFLDRAIEIVGQLNEAVPEETRKKVEAL